MFKVGQVVSLYNIYEALIENVGVEFIKLHIYKQYGSNRILSISYNLHFSDQNKLEILREHVKESKLPGWF